MATQTSLGAQTVVVAAGGVVPCPGGDCDMGGLRATSTATDPSGPPGVGDAEGVVLSGTREELFVFGGFEGFRPRAAASTAIARLRVEPSTGEVELAGIEFLEREVIGKPLGVEGGVLVVRQPALGTGSAGPARELLAAARFTARPAAWCPVAGGS